ncbi:dihydrofolate reductase [Pseudoflavitalea sp. G-6-1-2]|uniref:dihydrofolate reductase family protein n=1 Tax=Pseudoflavitalea sp. G-6-1-2 TaxID=2728841 RepID=UPI00146D0138|nr:dihydrofolate reductase family protein [Pseudoflavitalea sp. G-6-1-2]NML21158.1 dihydrofolate reductase [Pseudoflavitalea sp. G-6-1-2]
MRKLKVFNFLTLNGYYKGPDDDISWNNHDHEENEHAKKGLYADNILLFGRVTYEMMAGFWPTSQALQQMPEIAKGMNSAEKIVFSSTLKNPQWEHTSVIGKDIVSAIRAMKQSAGKDLTILGSGSIISQFADAELIDEFELMINPVALGSGTSFLHNIKNTLSLQLITTRVLKNGCIVLNYQPK